MSSFPQFRAVAEHAVLVEFGTAIDEATHARVLHLDSMLALRPPPGFRESVPAYVNILVEFDPDETDHKAIILAVQSLMELPSEESRAFGRRRVEVCYDPPYAPDLAEVADRCGMTSDAVIAAHLSGDYRVFLYGFAPGYAYLGGVPEPLQLPRKDAAIRNVPAGSVIIAGPQCIVTTLTMPTGWWIIGRSPTRILRDDPERPTLFDVGDSIRFHRISPAEFDRAQA